MHLRSTILTNGWDDSGDDYKADPSKEYQIERIVSAYRSGRGWKLMVKWAGYPDPTPEPLCTRFLHSAVRILRSYQKFSSASTITTYCEQRAEQLLK